MQELHEKISRLCLNHFKNLPKTGKPNQGEWTVLSCIVKQNSVNNQLEVVSLGTGSKCIGRSKLSPAGDILNDSHAEIMCHRAFLCYLYEQINSSHSEIFTFDCDSSKFCLRDAFRFHFFTSHVPCGDAAIFPKQLDRDFGEVVGVEAAKRPAETDLNADVKRVKMDSDIFRTGAKCLPSDAKQDLHLNGLEYHTVGTVRTKPGRGDPTLSVSCSDKLAKWCHMGVQGALLSLLLDKPIYFSSVTIAGQTPYCDKALSRALFDRLHPTMLPSPYGQNKPSLGQTSDAFEFAKVDGKNPCPSSIAWWKAGSRVLEVAVEGKKQGVTRKKQNTRAGRLRISKIELFRNFLNIIKEKHLTIFEDDLTTITYGAAKAKAEEYQKAWEVLKRDGFKVWTIKHDSLLEFVID